MRKLTHMLAATAIAMCAGGAIAQDKPAPKPDSKPAPAAARPDKPAPKPDAPAAKPDAPSPGGGMDAEMLAEMAKMAAPGEEHAKLNKYVGRWQLTSKAWFGGPDSPPDESTSLAIIAPIMDGRFFTMTVRGEPMAGMPYAFEGFQLFGFDKAKQKHFSHWADNMGTGTMTSWGTSDAAGMVFTFEGEYTDPMMGLMKSKHTTTFTGNDAWKMVMLTTLADGSTSRFELSAVRVK